MLHFFSRLDHLHSKLISHSSSLLSLSSLVQLQCTVYVCSSSCQRQPNIHINKVHFTSSPGCICTRVSQQTLFLNFASSVESLVRMGVQRPQKKFQRYRPICKTNRGKWGIPGKRFKNVAQQPKIDFWKFSLVYPLEY